MRAAFYKVNRPGLQGIYSRLVRWIERGPYSHCELIFSDGMSASASWMDHGVRFKRIEFDLEHWDFLEVDGDEAAARAWFTAHEGEGYDLAGNLRFVLGFVPDSSKRWFCSEAMAAALGWRDPYRYGPCGLYAALQKQQPASAGFSLRGGA
ncbi:MAG: hypothetical protein EOO22_13570 [Comamonadaceae bacterium]|nr:MAG: hypothetical protein EOO22_13570 [Comamonadaceae bacterium]